MNTYFTITGHHTGKDWLVQMFDRGASCQEPGMWEITEHNSVSYWPAVGKSYYGSWPRSSLWRIKFHIWKIEHRWARKARRQKVIARIAAKHGQIESTSKERT